MATIPNWPGPRAVRTCTECKQSKLRCDSRERFPNPCSRCHSRDLQCTVDPSFRRTPARKRIEAMSKELNELRNQGRQPKAVSTTSNEEAGFLTDVTGTTPSIIATDDFELSVEAVEIGGVVISAEVAIDAFQIFASLFHPKTPFLVSIDINHIYHSSPFLFWTIIAIVASFATVPSAEGLFDQLIGPFDAMIKAEALTAPLNLQKIRALLLLCAWPMPVASQHDDPSWLHCGVVVNAALLLGIHHHGIQPNPRWAGSYPGTALERTTAWLGCFYVSGSLSMHLGLPAIIDSSSELARVNTCLNEYPIPRDFAGEIKLQAIVTDFTNILSHTANDGAVDSSILHLLDRELEGLKSAYPDQWGRMLEYSTLVAKLHMYGLVISRDRVGNTARDVLLKLSFSTALRIIYLANAQHNEPPLENCCGVPPRKQQRVHPKTYFKGLAFTTAFLLRYFSLNPSATPEEQQLAANHVVLSHSIFKACSIHTMDELGRVAKAFEELCQQGPMAMDSQHVAPGDRVGVQLLMRGMRQALGLPPRCAPDVEHQAQMTTTTTSTPSDTSSSLMRATDATFGGVSMDQMNMDPWSTDMVFSGQYWNDPAWGSLYPPFMDAQFPLRPNND